MDVDGLNPPDTGGPKSLSQVREETTSLKPPTTPQSSLEDDFPQRLHLKIPCVFSLQSFISSP
jgi:hypothetical protein